MKFLLNCLILILSLLLITGYLTVSSGIETRAYVIALGIDNGETENIKLSLQIAVLNSSSESGGSKQEESTIISVDCSDIDSGISLINSYISKQLDLSNCKAVIISEEVAQNGVSEYLNNFINNVEIRPNCNIIISKCPALDFLENVKPTFESIQTNYYESISKAVEYTGYTDDLYISDFYNQLLSTTGNPTALLGGINAGKNSKKVATSSNYKAEETGIDGENNSEIMGTAVFKNDKLIGELDNVETLCHLIITNKLKKATITIPNPLNHDSNISLSIHLNKQTKSHVELINGFPYIKCNVYVAR